MGHVLVDQSKLPKVHPALQSGNNPAAPSAVAKQRKLITASGKTPPVLVQINRG